MLLLLYVLHSNNKAVCTKQAMRMCLKGHDIRGVKVRFKLTVSGAKVNVLFGFWAVKCLKKGKKLNKEA